jgi:hypothetical protein
MNQLNVKMRPETSRVNESLVCTLNDAILTSTDIIAGKSYETYLRNFPSFGVNRQFCNKLDHFREKIYYLFCKPEA